jgi:prepilin-type N-terminal cleavage/methylation domain-containing protein
MRGERGVALLEVLMALAILAVAGTALAGATAAGVRSTTMAAERERASVRREMVLAGLTLLRKNELDAQVGEYPLGEFQVRIQRPRPTIYRIEVSGPTPGDAGTLVTLVYRGDGAAP